jgi:hypothetical protein
MTDQERAERLARAIDELIHGTTPPPDAPRLQDRELDHLLEVATLRLAGGGVVRRQSEASPRPVIAAAQVLSSGFSVLSSAERHMDEIWHEVCRHTGVDSSPPQFTSHPGGRDEQQNSPPRRVPRLRDLAANSVYRRLRERLRHDSVIAAHHYRGDWAP